MFQAGVYAEEETRRLTAAFDSLKESDFSLIDLEQRLNGLLGTLESKPGILFSLVRIAISGSPASPALFDTLNVLGKDTSLVRIERALSLLT